MSINKYQWAAIVAGLLAPALLLLTKREIEETKTVNSFDTPYSPYQPYNNLKAFLLMIQYAEGTIGPNAYYMLYGGTLFSDGSRHPNREITKGGITSTAAGAYQILYGTWVNIQQSLNLPDFSPLSQDKAAIELIRRRGALDDVYAGRFADAIYKCRKEWASLPGAGYGQNEKSIASLELMYRNAGGLLIA
jgi:muramidase (phage lysozyme)